MVSSSPLLAAVVLARPERVQHAAQAGVQDDGEHVLSRIVYINLDTSPARAERIESQCTHFSIPCARFPALDVDETRSALLQLGWAPLTAAEDPPENFSSPNRVSSGAANDNSSKAQDCYAVNVSNPATHLWRPMAHETNHSR